MRKLVIFMALLSIVACADYRCYELSSELVCVTDSRPCTDSLFDIEKTYNAREIELQYVVRNNTGEDVCLPLRSLSCDSHGSYISAELVDGSDTIRPTFHVMASSDKTGVIRAGDSLNIAVRLFCFPDWGNENCNVETDVKDIVSRLRLEYHRDDADACKPAVPATLSFPVNPATFSLKLIPRGASMDAQ